MDGYSVELQTISVPPLSDKKELQRVREEYARRLKRPRIEEDLSGGGRPQASTRTGKTTPTTRQQENKVKPARTPPQHPIDGGTDDEEEYHRWTEL